MSKNDQNNEEKNETAVEKRQPTVSERFVNNVHEQFQGLVGQQTTLTEHQKQLAVNLYIKIDTALKDQESARRNDRPEISWKNVNMQQLAIDAMHRIRLGLDAMIDNHIHPIAYFNSKTGQYDLDLQIGYAGKKYYRIEKAVEDVKDIVIELVHESDDFKQIKKDDTHQKDSYEFTINNPFDRGKVVGGFGYIIYEDESKNKVVTVSEEDFKKSENAAPSNKFWGKWGTRMRKKTLIHRVAEELTVDPEKVNQSFHYVEAQDNPYKDDMEVQIEQPTERESLDIDMSAGDLEKPEPSANGQDQVDFDELLAEVNKMGKQAHGGINEWVQASKAYVSQTGEDADGLHELSPEGLESVKQQLEADLEEA